MSITLTLLEMRKRFPGQWVLVADPRFDPSGQLQSGVLLAHSSHREEIYQKLRQTQSQSVSVEYLGEVPIDLAVVL